MDELGPLDGMLHIGIHGAETATFLAALDDLDRTSRDVASTFGDQHEEAVVALTAAILSYTGNLRRSDALLPPPAA